MLNHVFVHSDVYIQLTIASFRRLAPSKEPIYTTGWDCLHKADVNKS